MFASKTIGTIIVMALASLCALAQTPPPDANVQNSSPPGTGMITGQVVDQNKQGVPNVVVQIIANRSGTRYTAISDRNGEFQVKDLEPVDYGISVQMPSYDVERIEAAAGRNLRVGDRISVRLIKGGVVTGKVSDVNGNPVVAVMVRAQMIRDSYGRSSTGGFHRDRSTDDRGVYRIYGLRPGTYVVFAGGSETSNRMSYQSTFEQDAPTYAPSATRETAAEISVRASEEVGDVDIRYRGEQGRFISGLVTLPSNTHVSFYVTLTGSGNIGAPWSTSVNMRAGQTFVFNGVADGDYSLIARSSDADGETAISELKRITVDGADVTGIQLTTKLFGAVSGRVVLEDTKIAECTDKENPLANETLVLASANENENAQLSPPALWSHNDPVRTDKEGNFRLKNLVPSEYQFGLRFKAPQWYVKSIAFVPQARPNATASPVDAARVWTNVKGNDRLTGLTITLVHGAASLHGMVVGAEGKEIPAQLVAYLLPAEPAKANDVLRFFAAPVESNSSFGFDNVPPGRYWVVLQSAEKGVDSALTKIRLPHESATRSHLRREAQAAKYEIELKPCQNITDYKLQLKPSP